jgi:hypothetical protein
MVSDTTQVGGGSPIAAGTGNIGGLTGLSGGNFMLGVPATAKVILTPVATYTFFADDGPLPYLTYNVPLAADDTEGKKIKDLIEDHFSEVYKGTKVGTMVDNKVTGRVESIEAPYLDVSGRLVLTLKFPPKPEVIDDTYFTEAVLGDLLVVPTDGNDWPAALTGIDTSAPVPFTVFSPGIVWTTNEPDNEGEFVVGFDYTATITLKPKANYTFIDSDVGTIETTLDDNINGWGSGGSAVVKDALRTLTGVAVEPEDDLIESDRDKLVITLKWTAVP